MYLCLICIWKCDQQQKEIHSWVTNHVQASTLHIHPWAQLANRHGLTHFTLQCLRITQDRNHIKGMVLKQNQGERKREAAQVNTTIPQVPFTDWLMFEHGFYVSVGFLYSGS